MLSHPGEFLLFKKCYTKNLKKMFLFFKKHNQFHQLIGRKQKFATTRSLTSNQFQQQNCKQLYQETQLEVMPNCYTLGITPCACKISVNICGAFARLSASDLGLLQTFGPFKLCLSNTSESRVK